MKLRTQNVGSRLKKNLLAGLLSLTFLASIASHSFAIEKSDPLANLPSLGDAGGTELSTNDERKLGELIMRDYRAFGAVTEDPDITAYITKLGGRIASAAGQSPSNFEFFLVADKSINAFAMPGGFIGVHTGLIANAQSEAELASVLSHEVGHVTQRHIARMFSQQKQTSLVSTAAFIAAILVAASNPQAAQGLAAAGAGYSIDQQLGFSRDAEREADRIGFTTLTKAGFDPQGMVDFFGRLQQSSRLYENNAPAYLRTHPLTTERISDIRNRVGITGTGRATGESPFTGISAPSLSSSSTTAVDFGLVRVKALVYGDRTNQQLVDRLKSLEKPIPQLNISEPYALAYGRSLVLDNMGKKSEALKELERSIGLYEKNRSVMISKAQVPVVLKNQELNLKLALREVQNAGAPSAPIQTLAQLNAGDKALYSELENLRQEYRGDMSVRLLYAKGLRILGLYGEAEGYLRDLLSVYRSNAQLHDLMAQVSLGQGKRAEHHFYLAQSYAARSAYLPAIEQSQVAKQYARDNYYLHAEIDAKLREYKQKADEDRLAQKMFQ